MVNPTTEMYHYRPVQECESTKVERALNILKGVVERERRRHMMDTHLTPSMIDLIDSFTVNETSVNENLLRNPIIATKLNQVIGYDLASKVVKEAYRTNSSIFDVAEKMTTLTKTELIKILDPKKLI